MSEHSPPEEIRDEGLILGVQVWAGLKVNLWPVKPDNGETSSWMADGEGLVASSKRDADAESWLSAELPMLLSLPS